MYITLKYKERRINFEIHGLLDFHELCGGYLFQQRSYAAGHYEGKSGLIGGYRVFLRLSNSLYSCLPFESLAILYLRYSIYAEERLLQSLNRVRVFEY